MSGEVESRDYQRMAHLLRRAGFGADRDAVLAYMHKGFDATIHELLYPEKVLGPDTIETMQDRLQSNLLQRNNQADLQLWWLNRMAHTDRPLIEKMTLFWHGHFASAYSKVNDPILMYNQNQLFRRNALGNFRELAQGVSKDPAMIIYLDNQYNLKGHPNENYARELMELFTLGIGNYTEDDVREGARAFTGWTFNRGTGQYFFAERQHDDGPKTFLGQTGNFNGEDIVNIVTAQPACASFIMTKLMKFFVLDTPTPEDVKPFADIFVKNSLEIKPVLEALFKSPLFYSDRVMWSKVKSPTDFVVSVVRSTDAQIPVRYLPFAMRGMNQELFNPPSVKGWDGGKTWANTTTLLTRFNFAMQIAKLNEENQPLLARLEKEVGDNKLQSADEVVTYFTDSILHRPVSANTHSALVTYLNTGPQGEEMPFRPSFTGPAGRRSLLKVHGLMHMTMLTPEYQLV